MRLTAKVAFPYGGKHLKPGDSFEATAANARTLTAIGKAEIAEDKGVLLQARVKRKYKRRDMVAE